MGGKLDLCTRNQDSMVILNWKFCFISYRGTLIFRGECLKWDVATMISCFIRYKNSWDKTNCGLSFFTSLSNDHSFPVITCLSFCLLLCPITMICLNHIPMVSHHWIRVCLGTSLIWDFPFHLPSYWTSGSGMSFAETVHRCLSCPWGTPGELTIYAHLSTLITPFDLQIKIYLNFILPRATTQ